MQNINFELASPWPLPTLIELRNALSTQLTVKEGRSCFTTNRDVLDLHRRNPTLAKLLHGMSCAREDLLLREEDLPALAAAVNRVDDLERRPLPRFSFCSVTWEGEPCGVLVEKENLKGGGLIFVVTLFFLAKKARQVIRAEFRAARSQPEPFASLQTLTGWERCSMSNIGQSPVLTFLLRCIAGSHAYRFRHMKISDIAEADIGPGASQRENQLLIDLCSRAYAGELTCTRAIVPMELIVPDDMEHAMAYPLEEIKRFMSFHVDDGKAVTELLLYQVDGRFIMGDDYSAYLAYKALLFKRVPAVILGEFYSSEVGILERGHSELMPPLLLRSGGCDARSVRVDDMVKLQDRLAVLAPGKETAAEKFSRIYLEFCNLLSLRHKREADLHAFLKRYPAMIDGHVAKVYSEVRIGDYRADLVLQYEQSDRRILLIELEMDNAPIFNKKNRLRSSVVHASQQIEDWIGAIRSNATEMPEWLKGTYAAEGLVVIGRSVQLNDFQKQTLYNINSNRLVKIVTYDDLLERLGRLIAALEQASSET